MPRLGPDLPDTGVRLAPVHADEVGDPRDVASGIPAKRMPLLDVLIDRVHELAVGVELQLVGGAVADTDRASLAVPAERERPLARVAAPVEPIDVVHARPRPLRCMQE